MEAVSSDGSPVEAWAALPAEPELGTARHLIAGRRRVLDLGAGTGRIADPLIANGCYVVAVDDSEAMLSQIVATTTVCSRIEELSLDESFDAVLRDDQAVSALLEQAGLRLDSASDTWITATPALAVLA